jgi:hypothetical protein
LDILITCGPKGNFKLLHDDWTVDSGFTLLETDSFIFAAEVGETICGNALAVGGMDCYWICWL